jgi:DNA polymerase I
MLYTGYDSYPALKTLADKSMLNTEIGMRNFMWGIQIDSTEFSKIDLQVQEEVKKAEDKVKSLLPEGFNLNSGKQLGELFFEQLGEPVTFTTDAGEPSTNKEALEFIKEYGETDQAREAAAAIIDYKKWVKRLTTYIIPYRGIGLVRPRPVPAQQISGRWSYREPALQTWPKFMKGMFVPREGNKFVACDYSQAELRVMAVLSGDQPLIEAYGRGVDVHAANGSDLFNADMAKLKQQEIDTDTVGKGTYTQFRNIAKTVVFALNYSTLDDKIACKTLLSRLHTAGFAQTTYQMVLVAVQRWWRAHPAIKDFKAHLWAESQRKGYVEEYWSGRRRYFYGRPKDTEVFNFPLQAGVATFMDKAIQDIDALLDHSKEGLIVQVHDALVLEGPDEHRLAKLLRDNMRQEITYKNNKILLDIDCDVGTRYGHLEKYKQ